MADFSFEKKLHKQGYKIIAGVDEVGRGCFAGPVVAAAVIFNEEITKSTNNQIKQKGVVRVGEPHGRGPVLVSRRKGCGADERQDPVLINDSKQMTAKQREVSDKWIRKNALAFGIGSASVSQINKLGIKKATEIAFRKAIKNCDVKIEHLLIDAFYIPFVKGLRRKNQKPIIKGDAKSISIAAASIIAKVYRDKLMTSLSTKSKYKKYGWGKNKGYGTKEHREMIRKYGTSILHRKQFVETWLSKA
jgi:ribonuclease HII